MNTTRKIQKRNRKIVVNTKRKNRGILRQQIPAYSEICNTGYNTNAYRKCAGESEVKKLQYKIIKKGAELTLKHLQRIFRRKSNLKRLMERIPELRRKYGDL